MSSETNAGEARTDREELYPKETDGSTTISARPHLVRLVYVCLTCGSTVCEWREAPGHPGDCVECRNPAHLEGHR